MVLLMGFKYFAKWFHRYKMLSFIRFPDPSSNRNENTDLNDWILKNIPNFYCALKVIMNFRRKGIKIAITIQLFPLLAN